MEERREEREKERMERTGGEKKKRGNELNPHDPSWLVIP